MKIYREVKVSDRLPSESGGIIGYCDMADILQPFKDGANFILNKLK